MNLIFQIIGHLSNNTAKDEIPYLIIQKNSQMQVLSPSVSDFAIICRLTW